MDTLMENCCFLHELLENLSQIILLRKPLQTNAPSTISSVVFLTFIFYFFIFLNFFVWFFSFFSSFFFSFYFRVLNTIFPKPIFRTEPPKENGEDLSATAHSNNLGAVTNPEKGVGNLVNLISATDEPVPKHVDGISFCYLFCLCLHYAV